MLLPLLVDTKEAGRLARAIDQRADDQLSHAGHRTVEAAEALDVSYPEQAARLWRAAGMGIVNRGRSKGLRRTDISYDVFRNPAGLAVMSRVRIAPFSAARSMA